MRTAIMLTAGLATILGLVGCWSMNRHDDLDLVEPVQPVRSDAPYLGRVGVAKETDPQLPSAVESTLLLQEKYARVLEDLNREQQRSRDAADQNKKLNESAVRTQADLAKAQQELAEANALLIQMRQELEKWKNDVLGYRDEMRRVHEAEIEALAKVLNLLGGEVPKTTATAAETAAPAPDPAAPVVAKPAPAKAAAAPAGLKPATPTAAKTSALASPVSALPATTVVGERKDSTRGVSQ